MTWEGAVADLGGSLWVALGAGDARPSGHGSGSGQRVGEDAATVSAKASVVQGSYDEVYVTTETSSRRGGGNIRVESGLVFHWFAVATPRPPYNFPLEMRAERWEAAVEADGTTAPFLFVGQQDAWAALGIVGDHEVCVAARGWPASELRLVRLLIPPRADPLPPQ